MRLYPSLTWADKPFGSFEILLRYAVDSPHALPRAVDTPQILPRRCREGGRGGTGRHAAGGAAKSTLSDYLRAGQNHGAERMSVGREFSPEVDICPMAHHVECVAILEPVAKGA